MFNIEGRIVTKEYESLKKVLSMIEVKEGLNRDNIIEELKTKLEKQDRLLYYEWKIGKFDVNYVFHSFSLWIKFTLLTIAAENGHTNIVKVLLEKGADVNEKDWSGMTPLHLAAKNGYESVVKVLIQAGADVNAASQYGKTPLDYAESQNVVTVLLNEGGGSFLKASRKGKIAGGVTILLGTAIAVALFTTGTIAIPIAMAVVAVTAAELVVGCATYERSKPNTKVDGAEKPSAVLTTNEQQKAAL